MTIEWLPIDAIRLEFQPAERLDEETVAAYAATLMAGEDSNPVHVYFDGEHYWLADGFHRLAAARKIGAKEIKAEVTIGTFEDLTVEWERYLRELRNSLRESHRDG